MPTFRDTISSKRLQRLFDYWDRIRGERAMPSRVDIDPADIPDLLPYVALFDVEWEPLALRYRLVGTAVVTSREGMTPRDPTGRYIHDLSYRLGVEFVLRFYEDVARTGEPRFQTGVYPLNVQQVGTYHRLGLPLSGAVGKVDMLLAGFHRRFSGTPDRT